MKVLRLRLKNYRGVADAELRFDPRGVTIVEGPNETGKSSIAEAIGVLFEHLDSTKKTAVLEIKPVHRDDGAEIEADIETGPYAFTYSKRFHKRHETKLRVDRPKPESHTGREAHERAEAILKETIDVALWKALQIEQGEKLAGPKLAGQTRLSAALDAAAGSVRAGDREESLLESVRKEFKRHFWDNGEEGKELRERQKELEEQRKARDECERALRELETDVRSSEQTRREIAELEASERQLAIAARKHDAILESLRGLESETTTARAERDAADLEAHAAVDAVGRRHALSDDVVARKTAHDALVEELRLSDPARATATRELAEAEQAEELARATAAKAALFFELRRKDREYRHEELDLQQLKEREARVVKAKDEIAESELILARPPITDRDVEAIDAAQRELDDARARLTVGSPRVTLTARTGIELQLDGTTVALHAGESFDRTAERSLTIEVPGVAEVKVVAGSGAVELRATLEKARTALEQRLRAAQVPDLATARKALDERNEAARVAKDQRKLVVDNLRDLTEEQLRAKVESLRTRVEEYASRRASEPSLPTDFAAAKRFESDAEHEAKRVAADHASATLRLDQAQKKSKECDVSGAKAQTRVEHALQLIREAEEKLERARDEESDGALADRRLMAEEKARTKSLVSKAAERRLADATPDQARTLADNARKVADDAQQRLSGARDRLRELRVRLEVRGEQGLAEGFEVSTAACARLELELERTRARAAAAKLLHDTLVAAKKEAESAYVAPLQEQVEKLGRLVFGPTLQVELDPSLAIVRRTLDGVTVPFESLSGGAKEQLSLLMRLACAIIVAKEGGAPLVIDDALGYTDAGRLESMGAALALAGASCQVIVLTCMPERYRHVGGARRVRIETNGALPPQ